jgi:regulatory protein
MFVTKKVKESTAHSAYLYAIRLLAKRDYSQIKLTKKLKDRGYEKEHYSQAIEEVLELGYLREDNYIESRIKGFMYKGWSPTHIQQKLRQEQLEVHLDTIREVFKENHQSTDQQIQYLINKKVPLNKSFLEDKDAFYKLKTKILTFVVSKGHSFQDVKSELDNYFLNLQEEL